MSSNRHLTAVRTSSGFTLTEALVSVTILAVGIIGVLGAFSLSLRAATTATRLEEAVDIAQRQLELASSSSRQNMQPGGGSSGRYSWRLKLTELPHGLALASIEVKWLERGQLQEFRLSQIFRPREEESD